MKKSIHRFHGKNVEYLILIIIFFPFLAIYQLNRVQLSSATRERLWARSNHHGGGGLNGSTPASAAASSVPISSTTGGRNRRLSGNPSYNVYNNPPPTSDNNGYRSDSSILSNGRTGAAGESSVIYNNGGSIQTFSNSQLEGKTFFSHRNSSVESNSVWRVFSYIFCKYKPVFGLRKGLRFIFTRFENLSSASFW